jgi:thiol-disulfide isomerase/thioredoxin
VVENGSGGNREGGGDGQSGGFRPRNYSIFVGVAFIALILVAGVNLLNNADEGRILGSSNEGDLPLEQFAVPDARADVSGDANIAQDNCDSARIPCPEEHRRTPACDVNVPGAIRVCDLFDRPLVLSFWFTRGGSCEDEEDVFEYAYRRYKGEVNFLSINIRDSGSEVQDLIRERNWTHPVGLDRDGALSNLYRVGGCPTFVYAYPGGIAQSTSIGELTDAELSSNIEDLQRASEERARTLR